MCVPVHTLLVISLFESGNASLTGEELPCICPHQLWGDLRTICKTAACALALQHQPTLVSLTLSCPFTGSVNLQLLLNALFHHPTVRELYIDTPKDSTMDGSVHGSKMAAKGECVQKGHEESECLCRVCIAHP